MICKCVLFVLRTTSSTGAKIYGALPTSASMASAVVASRWRPAPPARYRRDSGRSRSSRKPQASVLFVNTWSRLGRCECHGAPEQNILVAQGNLALYYDALGRWEEAILMKRDVHSGYVKLHGEEALETLQCANNYACSLCRLKCFEEAKSLLRRTMPVARRVLRANNELRLRMRWIYAEALQKDGAATLDDLREAVETLQDLAPTTRRVLGGTHPVVAVVERSLLKSQIALCARTPPTGSA